ncbi:MAG TPA: hypothetical protein VN667_07465 [Burkholderiales bacterium]|nr:hypothetical protein [Burkholderiales bacterium]
MERMPSRAKIMALIAEEDYALFFQSLPFDFRLPPRYSDWHARFLSEDDAHKAAGLNTRHVLVRYTDMMGFLKRIGLKPSYAALETFAAFLERQAPDHK